MLIEIKKTYDQLNLADKVLIAGGFAKALDTPAGFNISGALDPNKADRFNTTLREQNKFLNMISNENIDGTTFDLDCYNIAARGLTQASSSAIVYPTDSDVAITNVGHQLVLKECQLKYYLKKSIIQEKSKQPGFQNFIQNLVIKAFGRDLAILSMEGLLDNFAASAFTAINKGFPTLFTADSAVHDVTYASYADQFERYAAMVAAMPEAYDEDSMVIFDTKAGVEAYWAVLANQDTTAASMQRANNAPMFMGIPIVKVPYLPANQIFMADPKNLFLGLARNGVEINVNNSPKDYAVEIIINTMADFEYITGDFVVYCS